MPRLALTLNQWCMVLPSRLWRLDPLQMLRLHMPQRQAMLPAHQVCLAAVLLVALSSGNL